MDVKLLVENAEKKFNSISEFSQFENYINVELSKYSQLPNLEKEVIKNIFKAKFLQKKSDIFDPDASKLYQKYVTQSAYSRYTNLQTWASINFAFYLYSYNKYEDCFSHFWICIRNLDVTNDDEVIEIADTHKKVAYFLSTSGQCKKAVNFLLKSKKYTQPKTKEMAGIVDNLGSCYLWLKNLNIAENYFQQSLQISKESGDELRYGKALGNLAIVASERKNYEKAIQLIQEDIAISKKLNETKNTIFALTVLANIYFKKNDLNKAEEIALEAKKLAETKAKFQSSDYDLTKILLQLYEKKGDEKAELLARRHLSILKDSLEKYDGENVIKRVGWENEINNLKLLAEAEKTNNEKQNFQKKVILLVSILLIIIIYYCILTQEGR